MKKTFVLFGVFALAVLFLQGCPVDSDNGNSNPDPGLVEEKLADPPAEAAQFDDITLATPFKKYGNHNPVMSQWFGADPWGLEYNGRLYLYMSDDHYPGYGNIADSANTPTVGNNYNTLISVHVISSADLVNWTDHGLIRAAANGGIASWVGQAFAPAAVKKTIDGKDWFFLYVGNNANGVYVLKGDKPTPDGNWIDPNGRALVDRSTPGSDNPKWCFDPAVFIDDDGAAYLYFGGGVQDELGGDYIANPNTARVVKLKDNMTERDGNVVHIDSVPYLLEDFGINKINGKYYFSYCSSSYHPEGRTSINYLTASTPMGPFATTQPIFQANVEDRVVESKLMMKNPLAFNMRFTNNHHAMFLFKDTYYMVYQTVELEDERARVLGYAVEDENELMVAPTDKTGYRSTSIDKVTVKSDGTITPVRMTLKGVDQAGHHDPYTETEAETIGVQAGITTNTSDGASGGLAVKGIDSGDWIALYGVDFGADGASKFKCRVTTPASGKGIIQIRDGLNGEPFGYAVIEAGASGFQDIEAGLLKRAKGVKDLVFVFYGEGWEFDTWQFEH